MGWLRRMFRSRGGARRRNALNREILNAYRSKRRGSRRHTAAILPPAPAPAPAVMQEEEEVIIPPVVTPEMEAQQDFLPPFMMDPPPITPYDYVPSPPYDYDADRNLYDWSKDPYAPIEVEDYEVPDYINRSTNHPSIRIDRPKSKRPPRPGPPAPAFVASRVSSLRPVPKPKTAEPIYVKEERPTTSSSSSSSSSSSRVVPPTPPPPPPLPPSRNEKREPDWDEFDFDSGLFQPTNTSSMTSFETSKQNLDRLKRTPPAAALPTPPARIEEEEEPDWDDFDFDSGLFQPTNTPSMTSFETSKRNLARLKRKPPKRKRTSGPST